MTCFMYADLLLKQIINSLHIIEKYQEGHTPLIRFFEIIDTLPTIKGVLPSNSTKNIRGKIEFKNAYFKYNEKANFVLSNLNLLINEGENVALIGISGAGKTTICNLIQRFYDLTSGEILIDDENIKNIPLNKLHKSIGVVEQNVYLFPGTIYENILYGNIKATEEEVIKAAKDANLLGFIESLPNKFRTDIGERGIRLSGGQKQRISIARMFLKKPKILILDEATSSLDFKTEKIIKDSLKNLSIDRTTITIAHKISTIKEANKILVLKDGVIAANGTHEELIKSSDVYRNFYENSI